MYFELAVTAFQLESLTLPPCVSKVMAYSVLVKLAVTVTFSVSVKVTTSPAFL